jgi:hypothetical protein
LRNGPPTPNPWPNLDPGQYPFARTNTSPPLAFDRNAGRPPRQIQWSLGIQREISKNLTIEASYVGNRGAWWEGNPLINVNALTADMIAKAGLDINSAADQKLLTSRLDSPTAAQRGFNKAPYSGFPMSNTVAQSLRPFPQFGTINYRWAPLGRTWYDGMQLKVTKRFSKGLDFTSGFTWQKELMMGGGDAITPTLAVVNDVFNRQGNKYISVYSRPFVWITAMNYRLPKLETNRALSYAIRDWTIGAVLEYSSGMPLLVPTAQNQLSSVLFRSTFANRVPGQPLFAKPVRDSSGKVTSYTPIDINDRSTYDPFTDFVLNPNAWVDPPAGQFGNSPAYYSDYRQQRRPSEAMTIGRVFPIKEGMSLTIRADFQNILNRMILANPTATNAKATQTWSAATGETSAGFGDIVTSSAPGTGSQQTGIIVARFQF